MRKNTHQLDGISTDKSLNCSALCTTSSQLWNQKKKMCEKDDYLISSVSVIKNVYGSNLDARNGAKHLAVEWGIICSPTLPLDYWQTSKNLHQDPTLYQKKILKKTPHITRALFMKWE